MTRTSRHEEQVPTPDPDTEPCDGDAYKRELTATLLRLCGDYLTTHASRHTHTELATFLHSRGVALDWFIDMLQLTTHDIDTNH